MFTGEYRHTVDDKGRIAVPVKFRAQLDPGSMVSGWLDDCLAIHTKTAWEELSNKIAALPITDDEGATVRSGSSSRTRRRRRWTSRAASCCRPPCASRSASRGEAVLVGSRDHAEIWAPDRWDSYRKALDDPRELASAFEGLGI